MSGSNENFLMLVFCEGMDERVPVTACPTLCSRQLCHLVGCVLPTVRLVDETVVWINQNYQSWPQRHSDEHQYLVCHFTNEV